MLEFGCKSAVYNAPMDTLVLNGGLGKDAASNLLSMLEVALVGLGPRA